MTSASDPAVASAQAALAFSLASAGYVPLLSLLVAGVAIPALPTGILPRRLGIAGPVIAASACSRPDLADRPVRRLAVAGRRGRSAARATAPSCHRLRRTP